MTPCRAAALLFFAPLAFGVLVCIAVANSLLTALEDAERERVTRVTERDISLDTASYGSDTRGYLSQVDIPVDMELDIRYIPADYTFEVN